MIGEEEMEGYAGRKGKESAGGALRGGDGRVGEDKL